MVIIKKKEIGDAFIKVKDNSWTQKLDSVVYPVFTREK